MVMATTVKKSLIYGGCVLILSTILFLVLSDWQQSNNQPRQTFTGGRTTGYLRETTTGDSNADSALFTETQARTIGFMDNSASVEDLVAECMRVTNIAPRPQALSLLERAKSNARHLYREYRQVIPQNSLSDYGSYCWKAPYSMAWTKSKYSVRIGNVSFDGRVSDADDHIRSYADSKFPNHRFSDNLACIPKIFLAGFPKCGSSFADCLIRQLLTIKTFSIKEPHFWVVTGKKGTAHMPTREDVGRYLYYYLPGLQEISRTVKDKVIMLDSAANKMFKWPRFTEMEHNLTNYCLLPSVLPRLIPSSKFIVVMRDPVGMLYSTFWYSCSRIGGRLPIETQLKGPDIFHDSIVSKINKFNDCMRNGYIPTISHACELGNGHNYSSCILHPDRLLLLDRCTHEIDFDDFSDMPNCGRTRVNMGLYYVHVRKWLSVVSRERFLFLTLEDFIHDITKCRHDLLEFLELETHESTSIEWRANSCDQNSQTEVDYKNDGRLQMRKDTKAVLQSFYTPFNELLSHLLQRPLWLY